MYVCAKIAQCHFVMLFQLAYLHVYIVCYKTAWLLWLIINIQWFGMDIYHLAISSLIKEVLFNLLICHPFNLYLVSSPLHR